MNINIKINIYSKYTSRIKYICNICITTIKYTHVINNCYKLGLQVPMLGKNVEYKVWYLSSSTMMSIRGGDHGRQTVEGENGGHLANGGGYGGWLSRGDNGGLASGGSTYGGGEDGQLAHGGGEDRWKR